MNGHRRHLRPTVAESTSPQDWTPLLALAHSERDVLDLCTERLASLDAREIETLPRDCRPVELEDRADLAVYALTLVRRHNADPCCIPLLASLAQFFALANVRIAQVLRHMQHEREGDALLSRMDHPPSRDPGSEGDRP